MEINRPIVKSMARQLITRTRPNPLMIGLVFIAVNLLLSFLQSQLMGMWKLGQFSISIRLPSTDTSPAAVMLILAMGLILWKTGSLNVSINTLVPNVVPGAWVLSLAIGLMLSILSTGFRSYCLKIRKGEKADHKSLLDGFTIFFKLILLKLLVSLLVFFQLLMFIVPGIIASYSYRQAEYILLENPELSPLECIRRSKDMMRGHRFDLFVLDLSFIGWELLSSILFFPMVWYLPYSGVCYAHYYIILKDMPELQRRFTEQNQNKNAE